MEALEQELATTELINRAFQLGAIQVREEILGLVHLLRGVKLRNLMEIGSQFGGTFYIWCRLASLGGMKISLDMPCPQAYKDVYGEASERELNGRVQKFQSFAPRVKVVTADSHSPQTKQQIADILGGEKLDFLFIDGDHSIEGVREDFYMYKEFVASGGLVAFHDIQHLGPLVLWEEIKRGEHGKLKTLEFNQKLHWAGLGVVQV